MRVLFSLIAVLSCVVFFAAVADAQTGEPQSAIIAFINQLPLLVTSLASLAASVGGIWISLRNSRRIQDVSSKVETVHTAANSLTERLERSVKEAGHATGMAEGKLAAEHDQLLRESGVEGARAQGMAQGALHITPAAAAPVLVPVSVIAAPAPATVFVPVPAAPATSAAIAKALSGDDLAGSADTSVAAKETVKAAVTTDALAEGNAKTADVLDAAKQTVDAAVATVDAAIAEQKKDLT